MITTIFYILIFVYALVILFFLIGLFKDSQPHSFLTPFVSVIIPAKNEKDNIDKIIRDLLMQTYDETNYEIILVDDESSDITPNICRSYANKHSNIKFLSTAGIDSPLKFKKRPLDYGIQYAKGEILLLTDADCRVRPEWIESMVSFFHEDTGMVIGHSHVNPAKTVREGIEALDFLMLSAGARSSVQLQIPLACTGQNLAYRKSVYNDCGGFNSFAEATGGDDVLLLQQIKHKTSYHVIAANDPKSYVFTSPSLNWRSFLSQRIRWASDSAYVKNIDPFFFGIIIVTFLVNLIPVIIIVTLLFSSAGLAPLVKGLIVKFFIEGALMMKTTDVFNRNDLRKSFVLWFLFQMPYIVAMGILSTGKKGGSWGGRNK